MKLHDSIFCIDAVPGDQVKQVRNKNVSMNFWVCSNYGALGNEALTHNVKS
jgi:hypothetical protein